MLAKSSLSALVCLTVSLLSGIAVTVPVRAGNPPVASTLALPQYTITDLGALGSDGYSNASAINDRGQIVGWSGTDYAEHGLRHTRAFLWQNGKMREITLPSEASYPSGYRINNRGQVLIKPQMLLNGVYIGRFPDYGYIWKAGHLQKLPMFEVIDLNAAGQLLTGSGHHEATRPTLWQAGPTLWRGDRQSLRLTTPPGFEQAFAHALNDKAQVVGEVINYDTQNGQQGKVRDQCPFLYRDGQMTLLQTPVGMTKGTAIALNNAGEVLIQGWAVPPHQGTYSALWKDGKWIDLDVEGKFPYLQARNLNNQGQVVGAYGTPDTIHAFLWQNGRTFDLNQFLPSQSGWKLLAAEAINNHGWIIGCGLYHGKERAYLLKPATL